VDDSRCADPSDSLRLVAVAATRAGRALFLLPGPPRWHVESGYALVPVELPGGPVADGETDDDALRRLVRDQLNVEIRVLATEWTFAPSQQHVIDRRAADAGRVDPLAETRRFVPEDLESRPNLRPVVARIFRGEVVGQLASEAYGAALWLTPMALRAIVRGLPLADLVTRPDVALEPLGGKTPPDDALVFLPSEYGERYLLRAAAKYGARAVFGAEAADAGE
jgi:hypothetical protein